MGKTVKLAGFALILVLLFSGAALAGGALGLQRGDQTATEDTPGAAHGGEPAAQGGGSVQDDGERAAHGVGESADPVRGLAVSERGLELALERSELHRNRSQELRFAILDQRGGALRDFSVEHEKRMHLILVRRDGQGFQHLHPRLDERGTWSTRVTLPNAGSYRVFADFKRDGRNSTLAADLHVDGEARHRPPLAPATTADAGDGYAVSLAAGSVRAAGPSELRFTVSRDGETVHTEPYLGAGGHLVALRVGDLAYLHVHPSSHAGGEGEGQAHDDGVTFATEFPSAGRYGLYLQFKHRGRVRTAAFGLEVVR